MIVEKLLCNALSFFEGIERTARDVGKIGFKLIVLSGLFVVRHEHVPAFESVLATHDGYARIVGAIPIGAFFVGVPKPSVPRVEVPSFLTSSPTCSGRTCLPRG